jgi:DNA/RNA endonuclease YhcR with UshA esterase domain
MKKLLALTSIASLFALNALSQTTIPVKDASKHIGENVRIYAKVFSTKLLTASNMVFLDLGGYHPNQDVTLVIKPGDKGKFKGQPEVDYKGRNVCVTGMLVDYKGKPEIILDNPAQLKLNMQDNVQPSMPVRN